MKRPASGMVLIELLLAISVVGLITTAGFRGLASLGEIVHRRNQAAVESTRIAGLESRFRRAWDQRLAHRFQSEPWLLVEGDPTPKANWLTLRRLRLKTVQADGQMAWWELDGESWGRIDVNAGAAGEWTPGTAPRQIHIRFPDAGFRQNQIGFAVYDNWP